MLLAAEFAKAAEKDRPEPQVPEAIVVKWLEAYALASEYAAHGDLVLAEDHDAIRHEPPDLEVRGILWVAWTTRIDPIARLVAGSRGLLAQGLVGAHLVELDSPSLERNALSLPF